MQQLPPQPASRFAHQEQRGGESVSMCSSTAWMESEEPLRATACPGLTAAAVDPKDSAAFQELCRVVGKEKGVITADVLFKLCRGLPANDGNATQAFEQIFSSAGTQGGAVLFQRAAMGGAKSFGRLALDSPSAAAAMVSAAATQRRCWGARPSPGQTSTISRMSAVCYTARAVGV